jgi:protein-disulfide isomerase
LAGPQSQKRDLNLLWFAVAALFLLNVGTIAYLVMGNKSQGDPHGHDNPMVEVPVAELLKPGPLDEMSLGDPNAPNVVVEYASMTCPHCAEFHAKLLPELKSKYVDTGKVRFIFREFPLDKLAAFAFMAARCAGKDGYFPMVEALFKTQDRWVTEDDPEAKIFEVAKQSGLSKEQFDQCMQDQKLFDNIVAVRKRANETFKVNSTPTFFVNGKPLDHPESVDDFAALME